jgi:hypothetical protein
MNPIGCREKSALGKKKTIREMNSVFFLDEFYLDEKE